MSNGVLMVMLDMFFSPLRVLPFGEMCDLMISRLLICHHFGADV